MSRGRVRRSSQTAVKVGDPPYIRAWGAFRPAPLVPDLGERPPLLPRAAPNLGERPPCPEFGLPATWGNAHLGTCGAFRPPKPGGSTTQTWGNTPWRLGGSTTQTWGNTHRKRQKPLAHKANSTR